MCGIVGIVHIDTDRVCSKERLLDMRDVMTHRGPDDSGLYLDGNVGLAHRRLSIIDLGTGHQPMTTADEGLWVVFNGEIYNYRELRKELEACGHVFRTNSDTEVLLHLYREFGEQCPTRLNGIFAFAIWDRSQRRLFLARDHMGIKPLYYYRGPETLVFASEIKALFRSGYVAPHCNADAVPEYFAFRHVSGDQTLFQDVKSLLPGHSMTVANGKIDIRQYWNLIAAPRREMASFPEALEELSSLLTSAVRMQLLSDVPLGTFCSGGVDSSLVTALCAQNTSGPINTYSVGFHEAGYDETAYARMVSKRYGTTHHELRVGNGEFAELLPQMIWHNDEPLNFANSIQIFALSKLARERVTVVLTGEGADELFAGYPRYRIPVLAARLQKLPLPLRRLLAATMRGVGERRLRKLAAVLCRPLSEVALFNCASMDLERVERMWPQTPTSAFRYRNAVLGQLGGSDSWLRRVSTLDQKTYLVSILNRQDKMSMAASIESRVPFLDYRLVEFANALPDRFKHAGSQTKAILKKLAERYLPNEVVYRRKSGFGVPLAQWLRGSDGLSKLALEVLTDERFREIGGDFRIRQILAEHREGHIDHSELLWTTLNFALWKDRFQVA
jgi:asparagine synthase (glutamine-hydrolysing)